VERRVSTFIELRFTVIRVISPLSPHWVRFTLLF